MKAPNHNVADQLRRASLSVVLNLAEGAARPTARDRRRFYSIAYASAREVQAILGLIDAGDSHLLADQVGGCLYKLIRLT